ncbi:nanos homolog 1-like [Conger conger]|uniref:nanos homolog 1-like n=1 Tax=Conger conger TaxID=82655 RepID=UPI002A5A2A18|nr:nanos homolog 1-like [Conger conger]
MDFLNHNYFNARSPYDYTFNFWNDYLGLSTLVTKSKNSAPQSPNSITESLKATLRLDDSPACSCVIGGSSEGGHLECCCPSTSHPPTSILDLKERFSIFSPFQKQSAGGPQQDRELGGRFSGFDLFGVERKMRKQTHRNKLEPKICVFCRNNGAPEEVYGSHVLKTPDGRVVCPILRAYTCPLCSANGDNAHTIKYCPLSKDHPAQRPLKGGRAVGETEQELDEPLVNIVDLDVLDRARATTKQFFKMSSNAKEKLIEVQQLMGRPALKLSVRYKEHNVLLLMQQWR